MWLQLKGKPQRVNKIYKSSRDSYKCAHEKQLQRVRKEVKSWRPKGYKFPQCARLCFYFVFPIPHDRAMRPTYQTGTRICNHKKELPIEWYIKFYTEALKGIFFHHYGNIWIGEAVRLHGFHQTTFIEIHESDRQFDISDLPIPVQHYLNGLEFDAKNPNRKPYPCDLRLQHYLPELLFSEDYSPSAAELLNT